MQQFKVHLVEKFSCAAREKNWQSKHRAVPLLLACEWLSANLWAGPRAESGTECTNGDWTGQLAGTNEFVVSADLNKQNSR